MCHHSKSECLQSPHFVLNSLPGTQWCVRVYLRQKINEDYIGIFLKRLDNIPESFKIENTIQGLDVNEKFIFGDFGPITHEFEAHKGRGYSATFDKISLFQQLINDVFVIKCILKPVFETTGRGILLQISYKDGFFTDLLLRADDAVFRVHKAMLSARWPKMLEKLNAEETSEITLDVRSNVLEAMLKYVYTGKLDFSESKLLSEVYVTASKYGLPNLQFMPDGARKAKTRINAEKMSFQWPIQNFSR
ncbi:TD and POZ domain-containing protein 4, partial [Stegodyphus mimosarum]